MDWGALGEETRFPESKEIKHVTRNEAEDPSCHVIALKRTMALCNGGEKHFMNRFSYSNSCTLKSSIPTGTGHHKFKTHQGYRSSSRQDWEIRETSSQKLKVRKRTGDLVYQ